MMDKNSSIDTREDIRISILSYHFILSKLDFKEIETGDNLSDKNISVHRKMICNILPYSVYIRNKYDDIIINNNSDFEKEIKKNDSNSTFVLKENNSSILKVLEMCNQSIDDLLEDIIENVIESI